MRDSAHSKRVQAHRDVNGTVELEVPVFWSAVRKSTLYFKYSSKN